ncbi:hotdog domain-containing protein [Dankookia sp. P2]|uniref:hotdog domain-containing protein n=1 Tax=Dankookia sp. P2 TaxID=3423955 RepID=UPI003D66975E
MGGAHGGFVATLADLALVHAVAVAREKAGLPRARLATVNLSIDFIGAAEGGLLARGAGAGDAHGPQSGLYRGHDVRRRQARGARQRRLRHEGAEGIGKGWWAP